jgi:hypothetical protein
MQFVHAPLSQPYWVYHPGIAFDGLMRRRSRPSRPAVHGNLAATVARSSDELRRAAALVESRYAARGYRLELEDGAVRPGATLIASEHDAIVGTVTLSLDGPAGLAADGSYGDAIAAVRCTRGAVCEFTRLSVARGADSRAVLGALFGAAYLVARRLHRVTDAFIEVNPRHVAFYRALFGFAVVAGERVCQRVMAPAVLLRLEIERLEARLAEHRLPRLA